MSGYWSGVATATVGAAIGNALFSVASAPDLKVDFSDETKAVAKVGRLTVADTCTEHAKMSQKIADYFARQAEDGLKNPEFVITKEECEALVAAKKHAASAPAARP